MCINYQVSIAVELQVSVINYHVIKYQLSSINEQLLLSSIKYQVLRNRHNFGVDFVLKDHHQRELNVINISDVTDPILTKL